jgi:hypothetical protein
MNAVHKLAAIALLLPLNLMAAGVTVSVNPGTATIAPGDSILLDIVGNYHGTDKLLGGAVGLNFQSDLLELVSVTVTASQDVAGSAGAVEFHGDKGVLTGLGFATFLGEAGTFKLATIEFKARGPAGTSEITPFDALDPVFVWVNESFETVDVSVVAGTITVVPEAETWAMLLAGLGLLGLHSVRRST